MSLSYGWEKLHLAIHALTGQGTQTERLSDAIVFNLIHVSPENDLPEEMREEFTAFMGEMSSLEAIGDEGTIQATVNTFDEIERKRAIEKIISFYDTVCRHSDPF
jgi:hypothetical protein